MLFWRHSDPVVSIPQVHTLVRFSCFYNTTTLSVHLLPNETHFTSSVSGLNIFLKFVSAVFTLTDVLCCNIYNLVNAAY